MGKKQHIDQRVSNFNLPLLGIIVKDSGQSKVILVYPSGIKGYHKILFL